MTNTTTRRFRGKRLLLVPFIAVAALASAASLGGVTGGSAGAENGAFGSCSTTGVTAEISTTIFDSTDDRYEATAVTITNIDPACAGQTLSISLVDDAGAELSVDNTVVITDVTETFDVSADDVAVTAVGPIHVAIVS